MAYDEIDFDEVVKDFVEKYDLIAVSAEHLYGDEILLVVDPRRKTFTFGRTKEDRATMRAERLEYVTLNGDPVLTRRYAITNDGWASTPTLTYDEDALFYQK